MNPLPRISIIVPCYQSGATLARALDSLLVQDYPDLEILVIDGGSSDQTVEILSAYASRITAWVSEADRGQAHALNKGFERASGEIHGWLCADDTLEPGALQLVGSLFAQLPGYDGVAGACAMVYPKDPAKDFVFHPRADFLELLPAFNGVMQPSVFWRARCVQRNPVVDESYHYALDAELWCYLQRQGARFGVVDEILSTFIQDGQNKTSSGGQAIGFELDRLYRTYSTDRIPLSFWYRHLRYPLECHLRRDRGPFRRGLLGVFQVLWMLLFWPFYGWSKVRNMSWPA